MTHRGWYSRGYLPHFDGPNTVQHVVFRLADSLPKQVLERLRSAPADVRLDLAENSLDAGLGSRHLAVPEVAQIVVDALLSSDGERYELQAWCVMPSHVHVLVLQTEHFALASIVHSWKSYTANRANKTLGRTGPFWAPDYFDRAMRDAEQVEAAANYVEYNPVAAGLCESLGGWPWSSAWASRDERRASEKSRLEARVPEGGERQ